MKKLIIITYYWPPSGGGGVQRWLKFSKYLHLYGFRPIIVTPQNPTAPATDNSLESDIPEDCEVHRLPIVEPYGWYNRLTGKKKNQKMGAAFASDKKQNKLLEKVSIWIRSNFFIPDARLFWVNPVVKYLRQYLKTNPVEIIVTTGPPHSLHLIGLKLKRKMNFKWIADFRDPWTGIDYFDELFLTSLARKKHEKLEAKVLDKADHVITVSDANTNDFKLKTRTPVTTITNGYDPDDFNTGTVKLDEKFTLAHIGTFMANRNSPILWNALEELLAEHPLLRENLQLKFIGHVDQLVLESIKSYGLHNYLNRMNYLPHPEVIQEMKKSNVLLLFINKTGNNKGMLTGKMFEYLASERPILCVGPQKSDVANILDKTKAGFIVDFEDCVMMKERILHLYDKYQAGRLTSMSKGIQQFSRKSLTGKLAELLNKIV